MDPAGFMKTRALTGEDLERALPALAALRIEVFRAFAYLYAGSPGYEMRYLRDFPGAKDSFILGAETDPGESVLQLAYSGQGLGHAFSDAREAYARARG
jgi:hypothetical protein